MIFMNNLFKNEIANKNFMKILILRERQRWVMGIEFYNFVAKLRQKVAKIAWILSF